MRPFIKSKEPASFASMRILLPSTRLGIRLFHTVGQATRGVMLNVSKIRARLSTSTGRGRDAGSWRLPDYEEPVSGDQTQPQATSRPDGNERQ
jgi:hypothetical protein